VAGHGLPPERVRDVLGYLAAGLNPMQAARAAGVSKSVVYRLDQAVSGVSRLAVKRQAAARRAAERAASPGRGLPPERVRLLADQLAAGLNPMQAAAAAGVSTSSAYRLHHKMGGVYRPPAVIYSDRYLNREERYELARLREAGLSMRAIAARMRRAPSTISRELARNTGPRTGAYQPEQAHRLAWQRQRRPKPSRLSGHPALRGQVQQLLDRRYSPEQVSGRLTVLYPDDPAMRVSHETIYQSIYVYPRGQLRRELKACLRTGRDVRRRRGRREIRGRIIDAVPIGARPAEVAGRLVPGHHEGDLIMGSKASNSAVGTIVERTTGYLTLLPLPGGHDAASVADAIIAQLSALPPWFAKTLTWDRGTELAQHKRITAQAGLAVYFADPYSPWQRGSNENTNGLVREYLPKGTNLNAWTPAQLAAIASELNDRPRKRLGYHTPREQFAKLLAENQRVATTP
jgi:transposase, IS30 family